MEKRTDYEAPADEDMYDGYTILVEDEVDDEQMSRICAELMRLMPTKWWIVRPSSRGESVGTYGTGGGRMQILGYSIPVPERVERAIHAAWELSL